MADRTVNCAGGKYAVVIPEASGQPYMLRYGELWDGHRTPNNVELAFAQRVAELEDAVLALFSEEVPTRKGDEYASICEFFRKVMPRA